MPPAAKAPAKPDDFLRQAVKKAAQAQDHNTTDIAAGAGIHRLDLHRWLSGERGIRSEKLAKVMKYLGISVSPYSNKAPKK